MAEMYWLHRLSHCTFTSSIVRSRLGGRAEVVRSTWLGYSEGSSREVGVDVMTVYRYGMDSSREVGVNVMTVYR